MSDSLRIRCKDCESLLKVPRQYRGKTIKCPKCSGRISIPMTPAKSGDTSETKPRRAGNLSNPPSSLNDSLQTSRQSRSEATMTDSPAREERRRRKSPRASERRSTTQGASNSDFDLSAALEGVEEYEDLSPTADYEDYEDYEAKPSRRKPKRDAIDTSVRGVWRDGSILVLMHGARLPKRCIKTNQPGFKKKHCEFAYSHPLVYIVQLPLILVMAVFGGGFVVFHRYRKAELDVYYSKSWVRKRRNARLTGLITCIAGMGMIYVGLVNTKLLLAGVGFLCMVGGLILAGLEHSLRVKKIDDTYVRLRGAGRPFLNSLPDWLKNRER